MKAKKKHAIFIVIGTVLIVIGSLCLTVIQTVGKNIFDREIQLRKGTRAYNLWKDYPFEIPVQFYFFNCTNSEQVIAGLEIPNLEEVGPYVYDMHWKKKIGSEVGCKIEYRHIRTWHFNEKHSNGSKDDNIVLPNLVLAGMHYVANLSKSTANIGWEWVIDKVLEACETADDTKLYMNITVDQLLFSGFYSCIMKMAYALLTNVLEVTVPPFFNENGILSLLGQRNDTATQEYVVHTGQCDLKMRNMVYSFNGSTTLLDWEGDYCANITGTDPEMWLPYNHPEDDFTFLIGLIRRQLRFEYISTVHVHDIRGYLLYFRADNFANSTVYPDNACYEKEGIFPSGLYKFPGMPVFLSTAHYYGGDPYIYDGVINGISPDADKHLSYYVVEPKSGVPLSARIAVQGNIVMVPGSKNASYNYFNKLYSHPMFWVKLEGSMPEQYADLLFLVIETAPVLLDSVGGCLIAVGSVFIIWNAFFLFRLLK